MKHIIVSGGLSVFLLCLSPLEFIVIELKCSFTQKHKYLSISYQKIAMKWCFSLIISFITSIKNLVYFWEINIITVENHWRAQWSESNGSYWRWEHLDFSISGEVEKNLMETICALVIFNCYSDCAYICWKSGNYTIQLFFHSSEHKINATICRWIDRWSVLLAEDNAI